jgi:multidrug resistance efflux pump
LLRILNISAAHPAWARCPPPSPAPAPTRRQQLERLEQQLAEAQAEVAQLKADKAVVGCSLRWRIAALRALRPALLAGQRAGAPHIRQQLVLPAATARAGCA